MKELIKLPRLEKKKLRKTLWCYPADEKGNSLVAFPYKYKADYEAMKTGIVKNVMDMDLDENPKLIEAKKSLDKEIYITNLELKSYVDDIFAEKYRNESYQRRSAAKSGLDLTRFSVFCGYLAYFSDAFLSGK